MQDRITMVDPIAERKLRNTFAPCRFASGLYKAVCLLFVVLALQLQPLRTSHGGEIYRAYAQTLPGLENGVIAHWTLDETSGTRVDSVGSHDLSDNGDVGYETGVLGNAATFSGTKYLSAPDSNEFTNDEFTITMWIKFGSINDQKAILGQWSTTNDKSFLIDHSYATTHVRFKVSNNGSNETVLLGPTHPSQGVWHFLSVWKASNNIGIQFDGARNTTPMSGSLYNSNQPFIIGKFDSYNSLNGALDNLTFWDRALSAEELNALYNAGMGCEYPFLNCGLSGAPPKPIACWDLDETDGTRSDYFGSSDFTQIGGSVASTTGLIGTAALFGTAPTPGLSASDNISLSLSTDSPFTFAFWAYLNDADPQKSMLGKGTNFAPAGSSTEYSLGWDSDTGFQLNIGNGTSHSELTEGAALASPPSMWHYVIGWHDPVLNKIYLQVDDKIPHSQSWSGGTLDTTAPLQTDLAYPGMNDGKLDVVTFWKTTLSEKQRRWLYNNGLGRSCADIGNPPVFDGSVLNQGDNKTVITSEIETDGNISYLSCTTQKACGDPINTRTGGFSFTLADLSFPTPAGELVFQRSYSSQGVNQYSLPLGHGWTHNHAVRLIFPADPGGIPGYVLFQSVLGNQFLFEIKADGSFAPGAGVMASLVQTGTNPVTYAVTTPQQSKFLFDANGRLDSREDALGHSFVYEYDGQARLEVVRTEDESRFIEISYDGQGRISAVSDHAGRQVTYGYDAAGDLVSSTDVLEQTWTYTYDSAHHMTQAIDPDGKETVPTEYDAEGRAYRQWDGEWNLLVRIEYHPDGSSTIYDGLDHTREYQYDQRNTVSQSTDEMGNVEINTLAMNFRPEAISNSAGHTLNMTWSADGINLLSKTDPAGDHTQYAYDSLNNLTTIIDGRGYTTTHTYDGSLLTGTMDAMGEVITYTYTVEGYLESVTDAMGRTSSYTYDAQGQRISMTDPGENTWIYTYDTLGRLIDTTDGRSRVTHNEYNAAGQLLRVTQNYDPGRVQNAENQYNIVTEYDYDVRGNQTAVTDTYGRTTYYEYDDAGRLILITDPAGNETVNTYDAAGRLVTATDARENTTRYEYDALGRQVRTINALGISSGTTVYDAETNTSTVTNIAGHFTTFYYDELGRIIKVVDPKGNYTTTTYDDNGNVIERTDQLRRPTTYEYDALNRLVRITAADGGETETAYDAAGNRTATTDPLDHITTYTYDDVGRLIAVTDPLERVTQTEYDEYGRRNATIDAQSRRTTYSYDLLDRVIAVTDPAGKTTHTTYDALGNVLTRTDANGHTTSMTYDNLNRLLTTTDPNENVTINAYDEVGNLVSVTDPLGNSTTYTYDALNRQTAVTDPLGNSSQTEYDDLGNVSATIDANGVVTHYEYNELNRQEAVIFNYRPGFQPDEETNVRYEFGYNAVGNRVSVTDANGHVTTYSYDAMNRLLEKTDPLDHTWSYEYDQAGRRISATDAEGETVVYRYDDAGQLTSIDYPGASADVSYSYNDSGLREVMTDTLGTTTWAYDSLNRLIAVTDPNGATIEYGYDDAVNRTSLTYPQDQTVVYEYDDANRLVRVWDWDSQATEYSYDANGQLVSVSRPNQVATFFTYNDAGRLIRLDHSQMGVWLTRYDYSYDPAGNRILARERLTDMTVFYLPLLESGSVGGGEGDGAAAPPPGEETAPGDADSASSPYPPPESLDPGVGSPDEGQPGLDSPYPPPEGETGIIHSILRGIADFFTRILSWGAIPAQASSKPGGLPEVDHSSLHITEPYSVTIGYSYDPLNRLTDATYSDGRSFGYTYDAAGNVLQADRTLEGGPVSTTYTYDDADQLSTAYENGVTWEYAYDDNGRLSETLPGGMPGAGAQRYAYNQAGYLAQVEAYDGSGWNVQAGMTYNGIGQRLSMSAGGVTSTYVMDGAQPLSAQTGENTTLFLYGRGAIAEKTGAWAYALPDGANTQRHMSDAQGDVTLAVSYDPWGNVIDSSGTGNFTFGYFGGVMDLSTGLIYVGEGQYYDPTTGRFLTREAKPDHANPYTPWDPMGALLGPLGLVALYYSRKKGKDSRWGLLVIALLFAAVAGASLSACGGEQTVEFTATYRPSTQTATLTIEGVGTFTVSTPTLSGTPIPSATYTCTLTPTGTPTSTPIPQPNCEDLPGGAKAMCDTYLALRDHAGWWNNNAAGSLTAQKFLGLLLRMEFNGMGGAGADKIDTSIQQETTVRNFYAHCPYWEGCSGDSRRDGDIFVYIDHKRLLWLRPQMILPKDADSTRVASVWIDHPQYSKADFEFGFLHPGEWVNGIGNLEAVDGELLYTAPFDWGNISMIKDSKKYKEAKKLIEDNKAVGKGKNRFYTVTGGGDPFVIMTRSQRWYWKSE